MATLDHKNAKLLQTEKMKTQWLMTQYRPTSFHGLGGLVHKTTLIRLFTILS